MRKLFENIIDNIDGSNINKDIQNNEEETTEYSFFVRFDIPEKVKVFTVEQWKRFCIYLSRLLIFCDIIEDGEIQALILDTPSGKTKPVLAHMVSDAVQLLRTRGVFYLICPLRGTLHTSLTDDYTISCQEQVIYNIGRFLDKLNLKDIKVFAGFQLNNETISKLSTRYEIVTIPETKFKKLIYVDTISKDTLDGDEVTVNKEFTFDSLDKSNHNSYYITLYRILKNKVITSDDSYMKHYYVNNDKPSITSSNVIENNEELTKKLLNNIIKEINSKSHISRQWFWTNSSKTHLSLTNSLNLCIIINDERYVINIDHNIVTNKIPEIVDLVELSDKLSGNKTELKNELLSQGIYLP